MPITILAPAPASVSHRKEVSSDDSDDSDEGGVDLGGDVDMRPMKRARHSGGIVTPGEIVTDDPKWMRYGPK
jgi:exosome complex component RRP4